MSGRNKKILMAIAISVAAHTVFFAASPHITLSGMDKVADRTRKIFRIREVEDRVVDVTLFGETESRAPETRITQREPLEDSITFRKMTPDVKKKEDLSLESKKEKMRDERSKDLSLPELEKLDDSHLLRAEADKARKLSEPEKRTLVRRVLSRGPSSRSGAPAVAVEALDHTAEYDGFSGAAPEKGTWEPAAGAFLPDEKKMAAERGVRRVGDYEDISSYLDLDLRTYEDPETREKYFRLLVNVKEGVRLEVIPKNITFLIDSSKSITEKKLSYIKEGVSDSVARMNPGDRFNVVAFRGSLVKFRPEPVRATPRNVGMGRSFIRGLRATGQTDVENALLGIIEEPIVSYPSYVVLVSDGRPTTGAVDSRRIIQAITRRNERRRPIFCFGGGKKVNKYLLEFISYQNRAWSEFAQTSHGIRKEFGGFYEQIKDPLLLNVRYRLNGVDAASVYPKYLSDFYHGRPFELYGRYADEDVFSMQILGEVKNTTKEFIFRRSLREAAKGGKNIAAGWAFRKIYYLISLDTMGVDDPDVLRNEIDLLSRKYGISTPYDLEDVE